jgi:hypothetical protein
MSLLNSVPVADSTNVVVPRIDDDKMKKPRK